MRLKTSLLLAGTLVLAVADAASADEKHGSLSLLVENDLFYDTDRDYTSGVQINYTTAPQDTPDGLVDFTHWMPLMSGTGDVRAGFELGQDIFTPADTLSVIPPITQRPYAGYLYVGLSLFALPET